MAEVNDVLGSVKGEQSFYIPGSDSEKEAKRKPIVTGKYLCHIVDVQTNTRDVKGKYKGKVYNYTVQVSPKNEAYDYSYEDFKTKETISFSGDEYKGYKFKGSVWRFLEPQDGDSFEAYPSGNKGYMYFCEAINVECPKETKKINGKDIEVSTLPNLSVDDMMGQPVIATVDKGRTFKDKYGKDRTFYDCKFVNKWEGGETISVESKNEIPF